ncbi:uncharacterized protein FIBRA_07315 [Fibroporia radiculosa]|uniref:Uncharacterized protein n=1 Tax=Fibroporia radiculosa TaxID=599839 RepID=J4GE36_9APHY|nr:uncharacterized protein FIBRA_07315 [Fibroporia radiculosa]CCM05108.1 predicted protein [Fibroporia radiculosa]
MRSPSYAGMYDTTTWTAARGAVAQPELAATALGCATFAIFVSENAEAVPVPGAGLALLARRDQWLPFTPQAVRWTPRSQACGPSYGGTVSDAEVPANEEDEDRRVRESVHHGARGGTRAPAADADSDRICPSRPRIRLDRRTTSRTSTGRARPVHAARTARTQRRGSARAPTEGWQWQEAARARARLGLGERGCSSLGWFHDGSMAL